MVQGISRLDGLRFPPRAGLGDKIESEMTRIYLVRHGSTAWNEIVRFRGLTDIPLSDLGRREAHRLSRAMKNLSISAIYTSPLERARKTAEIINKYHSAPIFVRDGLKSVSYGEWEGKTLKEVEAEYPQLYRLYVEHIESIRFPGGENLDELRRRAMAVAEEAVASYPAGNVVLVSHQVVTRILIVAALSADNSLYWRIGQDPGCLNIIDGKEGNFILQLLNWRGRIQNEEENPTE